METERIGRDWIPFGLTLSGMIVYTLICRWLEVTPGGLTFDRDLQSMDTITGQTAALLHFRASAVLATISALAGATAAIFLMLSYLAEQTRFHLGLLAVVVLVSVTVNPFTSIASAQLAQTICFDPKQALKLAEAFRFCNSPAVIGPFLDAASPGHSALDFRQLLNLPLAASGACIGYAVFTLASVVPRAEDSVAREKIIAIVMAFGGAMLVFVTLMDREYARWAFSGTVPTTASTAFIDGLTFYSGATSSALLAMIWLSAVGLLIWRRNGKYGIDLNRVFSRKSAIFGIFSVIAPIIFSIVQQLFGKL